jgi:hypothetical protein
MLDQRLGLVLVLLALSGCHRQARSIGKHGGIPPDESAAASGDVDMGVFKRSAPSPRTETAKQMPVDDAALAALLSALLRTGRTESIAHLTPTDADCDAIRDILRPVFGTPAPMPLGESLVGNLIRPPRALAETGSGGKSCGGMAKKLLYESVRIERAKLLLLRTPVRYAPQRIQRLGEGRRGGLVMFELAWELSDGLIRVRMPDVVYLNGRYVLLEGIRTYVRRTE